jgi:acyl carrier protein
MKKESLEDSAILNILETACPDTDFSSSNNFSEDGLLGSLDIITLVSALDEGYDIDIDGRDILPENFSSIEAIRALVEKNLNRASQ